MPATPPVPPPAGGTEAFRSVCAWCGVVTRDGPPGAPTTHGICGACVAGSGILPVEDVSSLPQAVLDRLPFGAIRLDAAGRVIAYNRAEAAIAGTDPAQVVGRLFFTEVAPCAKVRAFGGEFLRLVAGGVSERASFLFVFRKGSLDTPVRIRLVYDAGSRTAMILVERIQ